MKNSYKGIDIHKKILKPRWYLMLVEWAATLYFSIINRVKYKKTNFKSFKEPSLILATHASMQDFASMVGLMFPYRTCWVISIEEFNGREWLFRHIGGIPKRKFTSDIILIKHIAEMIRKKHMSVVIYPETRFSLAGVNEQLSPALGKLAKLCKSRVIVVKQNGNFIVSPQWAKHPYRDNHVEAFATQLFSKEEVEKLDANIIQERIEQEFVYDDYKWQNDNRIRTKCNKRAENIHKILYKCPVCGKEGMTNSKGIHIWCENCNSKWEMDEYAELHCLTGENHFKLPSDWYRWEKDECYKEVNNRTYHFEDDIRIENLIDTHKKFVEIGTIHMSHDMNGFVLKGKLYDGNDFELIKPPLSMRSCHIEYDYKGRGDALDMATIDDTWWVYPVHPCCLTKFNFATEAIYAKAARENENNK